MKQLLLIAALALGLSAGGAFAQRPINLADMTGQTALDAVDGNLIQVHKKHKKYKKRYSRKNYHKHHRYYAYKHHRKHHRKYSHHDHYYGPLYGLGPYGTIILGNGAVIIRLY